MIRLLEVTVCSAEDKAVHKVSLVSSFQCRDAPIHFLFSIQITKLIKKEHGHTGAPAGAAQQLANYQLFGKKVRLY